MRKLWYIVDARFPTEKAHGVQIAKMCEALLEEKVDLKLIIPDRLNKTTLSPRQFYGLRPEIPYQKLWAADLSDMAIAKLPILHEIIYAVLSLTFYMGVLWGSLSSWRRDLIFTRDMYSPAFIWDKRRILWEVHELPKTMFGKELISWLAEKCRVVFCVNQAVKDFFANRGISKSKLVLLPNGVDSKMFQIKETAEQAKRKLGFPVKNPAVVYSGGFYRRKGVDLLVAAAKYLPDYYGVYLFGGPTSARLRLEKIIKDENLGKRVKLDTVPYHQIPLLLRAADVLVIPNVSWDAYASDQTSPVKLFEYLASGKPVVAARVPSIEKLVNENEVYFFRPDNVDDLTRKIILAAADKDSRRISLEKLGRYSLKRRAEEIKKRL